MHPAFQCVTHRPWPLPPTAWSWRLSWLDLACIHFRADAAPLQAMLPAGLRLQTFDGTAWLGVIPFRMAGVMRRSLPDLPGFSSFPELNLRTYVECGGKPGVWFFSLDADSWPIVFGGRRFFGLPYFRARIQRNVAAGWHTFRSVRRNGDARFAARYQPSGEVFAARPGGFEHWASERYCLYSHSPRRGLERVEVHHVPWPLQVAEVDIEHNGLFSAAGVTPLDVPPVCHFSSGVHVVSFDRETLPSPAS